MSAPFESRLVYLLRSTQISRSLLPSSDLILAAVSGGPDSTALLHALHTEGYKVHAAHLNHGLRAEAIDDEEYIKQFCGERGIPFTVGHADVRAEQVARGGGVQEVARAVRYEFLERTADEVGAAVIATAHTRDDRIETVLLNIIRGCGADGLRGIPYRRGRIVRPLLDVSRPEIEAYCAEHGLTPRHDASNDSTKYARNEVRHKLIPYLEGRFNPNARNAIWRLSEIAAEDSEYLDRLAGEWIGDAWVLDTTKLVLLPVSFQRRVVRCWLKCVCNLQDTDFEEVERVRLRATERFALDLRRGVHVVGDGKWISRDCLIEHSFETKAPESISIDVPNEARYLGWRVCALGRLESEHPTLVRTWVVGDRMRFPYGHKKLSDIFRESKFPNSERWNRPLLVNSATHEVLAIANSIVSPMAPNLIFTAELITEE